MATAPHMVGPVFPARAELLELIQELESIRKGMLDLESKVELGQFGTRKTSAKNLLDYVALRREDIRSIQEKLELMGISSLGRSESHVLYNIDAVIRILRGLAHERVGGDADVYGTSPLEGRMILERNSDALFGPRETGREVRMMVTMPSEAASEYSLVRDLVAAGMDCMRINCAHDKETDWLAMIENLRRAEREVGRKCRVLMDIAGPKLRTGMIEPGPRVLRIRPERDVYGRVVRPAMVLFCTPGSPKAPSGDLMTALEVNGAWVRRLEAGDVVTLTDSRGSERSLSISVGHGKVVKGETRKTIYIDAGTRLTVLKRGKRYSTSVSNIPPLENPIALRKGDRIIVTGSQDPGGPARGSEPARIPCTLPEAMAFVKAGERVWFDDGKIGGIVRKASSRDLEIEITAGADNTKLRGDKGINLPDTSLKLPPLTPKDVQDLRFIAEHADMLGYSFVRTSEDLRTLRSELAELGKEDMPIIIKVETLRAFEQLPTLLLEALRSPVSGVMIARGDLAVECGYERLAEVQEEILWMSEAAHLPTIWATQVLEGLTKSGIPSRAEVTDAAMGGRSECVMLNKGPHVVEALVALNGILRRMQAHQVKKKSRMRSLNIASSFLRSVGAS